MGGSPIQEEAIKIECYESSGHETRLGSGHLLSGGIRIVAKSLDSRARQSGFRSLRSSSLTA